MRLFTSYFANRALRQRTDLIQVAISRWSPRWSSTCDEVLRCLAPSHELFERKPARAEFTRLYRHGLDRIGVGRIEAELEAVSRRHGGKDLVLLCYERDAATCHRSILSQWLLEETGWRMLELPRFPASRRRCPKGQLALPLGATD